MILNTEYFFVLIFVACKRTWTRVYWRRETRGMGHKLEISHEALGSGKVEARLNNLKLNLRPLQCSALLISKEHLEPTA